MTTECTSVCIGTDDADTASVYHESTPRARRSVRCCECGGTILPGARYFKAVGNWDGEWTTFRQCLPCNEIQRVFSCNHNWLFGGLWEMWEDADGFANLTVRDPCFQRLSWAARVFLLDRWWAWRESHPYDE